MLRQDAGQSLLLSVNARGKTCSVPWKVPRRSTSGSSQDASKTLKRPHYGAFFYARMVVRFWSNLRSAPLALEQQNGEQGMSNDEVGRVSGQNRTSKFDIPCSTYSARRTLYLLEINILSINRVAPTRAATRATIALVGCFSSSSVLASQIFT